MTIFFGFPVYEWDIRMPSMHALHATLPPPGTPPPPPIAPTAPTTTDADAANIAAPPFFHMDGPNAVRHLSPLGSKLVRNCRGDGQGFAQAGHNSGFFIPHFSLYLNGLGNTLTPLHFAFSSCRWIFPVPHVLLEGSAAAISSSPLMPFLYCADPVSFPGVAYIPRCCTVMYSLSLEEWLGGLALFALSMGCDAVCKKIFGYSSTYFSASKFYEDFGRATFRETGRLLVRAGFQKELGNVATNMPLKFILDGRATGPFSLIGIDFLQGKITFIVWEFGEPPPGGAPESHPYIRRRLISAVTPTSSEVEEVCVPNSLLDELTSDLPEFEEIPG